MGLIVLRALAPEPGLMPMARQALAGATCDIQPVSSLFRDHHGGRKCGKARRHDDHHLVCGDLLLQFGEDAVRLGRDGLRFGNRKMFERKAIAGAALAQRFVDPGDRQAVLGDARLRVDALGRA